MGHDDDKPLERRRRVDKNPTWRKYDNSYVDKPSAMSSVQNQKESIINELTDQSPVNIFEKKIDAEVIHDSFEHAVVCHTK